MLISFDFVGTNNKSSHFHCLKCDFICTDTNKVVAHRRYHSKLESIRTAGFRKVAINEPCSASAKRTNGNDDEDSDDDDNETEEKNECIFELKQSHFHCLYCNGAVLNKTQISSHQHKTT